MTNHIKATIPNKSSPPYSSQPCGASLPAPEGFGALGLALAGPTVGVIAVGGSEFPDGFGHRDWPAVPANNSCSLDFAFSHPASGWCIVAHPSPLQRGQLANPHTPGTHRTYFPPIKSLMVLWTWYFVPLFGL